MDSILPIISMSDLQRSAKEKLEGLQDYAVIRRHGKDIAFVLHPALGKVLLESGLLDVLKEKLPHRHASAPASHQAAATAKAAPAAESLTELDTILGQVLRELSKR